MHFQTDVVVIGGGPAGLAAAIAARSRGLRVVAIEAANPPVDKACGEGLQPDALDALRALGVYVNPSEGFAFRGVRLVDGEYAVDASLPQGEGVGLRRPLLHAKMIDRAREAGVELLWNAPVRGICREGAFLSNGKLLTARHIIGADGVRSQVRKWSCLEPSRCYKTRFAFRRHYRITPWSDCVEIFWGDRAQAYITPVSKKEICVVLISSTPGGRFSRLGDEFPELAARLACATAISSERGAVTVTHRLKRVYSGNVALIGDASGGVDAITGEGLCLAFRQATALADALAHGDLRRYQIAHCRLARRPALMGELMLLLDAHNTLRKGAIRALAADSRIFKRLLAAHVGGASLAHLATSCALLFARLLNPTGWKEKATYEFACS